MLRLAFIPRSRREISGGGGEGGKWSYPMTSPLVLGACTCPVGMCWMRISPSCIQWPRHRGWYPWIFHKFGKELSKMERSSRVKFSVLSDWIFTWFGFYEYKCSFPNQTTETCLWRCSCKTNTPFYLACWICNGYWHIWRPNYTFYSQ